MGSKARRTAYSVAGLALASGATLALAAPASAATHTGDDGYASGTYEQGYDTDHESSAAVAGSYTKVEKTEVKWAAADKKRQSSHAATEGEWGKGKGHHPEKCDKNCDRDHDRDWDRDRDRDRDHGRDHDKGYHHDDKKWKKDRVKGLHRSYKACKQAGVRGVQRGSWEDFDCDFTKRGYKGWHQSWNKWGSNDWRCRGVWVLNVRDH